MKINIKSHARIEAFRTRNPVEIARLMKEAETVHLPESLYKTAADIARTVEANNKRDEILTPDFIAAYILRWAFLLMKSGELVEAPPKPKRPVKPKAGESAE